LRSSAWKNGDIGIFQEIENAHFFAVKRIVETVRDIGDFGEVDRQQEHVCNVDLPGALEHARRGNDKAVLPHGPAIDERRRVA
jgi:hypothetical protein